jgi:hypothetical protein
MIMNVGIRSTGTGRVDKTSLMVAYRGNVYELGHNGKNITKDQFRRDFIESDGGRGNGVEFDSRILHVKGRLSPALYRLGDAGDEGSVMLVSEVLPLLYNSGRYGMVKIDVHDGRFLTDEMTIYASAFGGVSMHDKTLLSVQHFRPEVVNYMVSELRNIGIDTVSEWAMDGKDSKPNMRDINLSDILKICNVNKIDIVSFKYNSLPKYEMGMLITRLISEGLGVDVFVNSSEVEELSAILRM